MAIIQIFAFMYSVWKMAKKGLHSVLIVETLLMSFLQPSIF